MEVDAKQVSDVNVCVFFGVMEETRCNLEEEFFHPVPVSADYQEISLWFLNLIIIPSISLDLVFTLYICTKKEARREADQECNGAMWLALPHPLPLTP